ncbi:hypothetical protein AB0L70_02155 [Kribbella sp. NPDC051952]|uniref:hypothetical protein n=1 Tax=Kribbella sp. NPDC051952 TaxID=3154851 RepID=UPI003423E9C0
MTTMKKLLVAGAGAAALIAGATVTHAFADTNSPGSTAVPAKKAVIAKPASSAPSKALAGSGTVDGKSWSVEVEYYAKVPKDFTVPGKVQIPTEKASLLCTHVTIGGVRVDARGGRWADCALSSGGAGGGAGLFGLTGKGLTGTRVFVGTPTNGVTRAVVTLADGKKLEGAAKPLSGTPYHLYAVAIGSGRTIAAVDEYAGATRISHDTYWR